MGCSFSYIPLLTLSNSTWLNYSFDAVVIVIVALHGELFASLMLTVTSLSGMLVSAIEALG